MVERRGRKSAVGLEVVQGSFGERPEAPAELTAAQQAIWKEIVASEPAAFFNTAALRSLLAEYCRHRDAGEMLSALINDFKPEWIKTAEGSNRYGALLRMRDLETRGAITAATKLRLTNQSRYTTLSAATAARNTAKGLRPWEE